jgi:hypothetical protein
MTRRRAATFTAKQLDRLIKDAVVDAYSESEQAAGFLTLMEAYKGLAWQPVALQYK